MKRFIILVAIAFIGLIVVPAAFAAFSGGLKVKPVKIVNPLPLPVQIVDEERSTLFQGSIGYSRTGSDPAVKTSLSPPPEPSMILTILL